MTANATPNDAWREPGEALLSVAELAAFLGVPVATIYRWRHQRRGPIGYRVGRHVRYRPPRYRAMAPSATGRRRKP